MCVASLPGALPGSLGSARRWADRDTSASTSSPVSGQYPFLSLKLPHNSCLLVSLKQVQVPQCPASSRSWVATCSLQSLPRTGSSARTGAPRGPDWQVKAGFLTNQRRARGKGHVSQRDSVQDAQSVVKEQGPGLPAGLSPFSGLWSSAPACQPPEGVSAPPAGHPLPPGLLLHLDPCSWYKLDFSPLGADTLLESPTLSRRPVKSLPG